MSSPEHILIFSLLFLLFIFWGRFYYKTSDNIEFWIYALIPILAFSLITGMRYGWGNDYFSYKNQFENAFSNHWEILDQNRLFILYNQVLQLIGLRYVGAFISYSLIFVICAFTLIRSYGKESKYMYAFFIPASIYLVTWTIRQGFSFSFVFLTIYFLNKKKWIGVIISAFIAGSIHSVGFVTASVIILFYFFARKSPISWKITIPLLVFFTFFFDFERLGILADYVHFISLGSSKFQAYFDNPDMWFSIDAIRDQWRQNIYAVILETLFSGGIFFLGYKALKHRANQSITYLYNTMVFGIVLYRAFFLFEALQRLVLPWVSLYFIVLGYSVFVLSSEMKGSFRTKVSLPLLYKLSYSAVIFYLLLYWGRWILFNDMTGFVWDR